MPQKGGGRVAFTHEDDMLLMKYLAKYNPEPAGRGGNLVYEQLVRFYPPLFFFPSFCVVQLKTLVIGSRKMEVEQEASLAIMARSLLQR